MLAAERKLLILELVNRRKFVKVVDLSRELKITEVTVRRDLEELDEQKKVRRVHGGAIAISLSLIHIYMVLIRFERLRDLKKIPSVMIWKKIAIRISANIIV